jgi:hypothetical protein
MTTIRRSSPDVSDPIARRNDHGIRRGWRNRRLRNQPGRKIMVVVALTSRAIRRTFRQEWILCSILYFIGLATTRGTVPYWQIVAAAIVLGFAQMFGGTLIRESGRLSYFNQRCGYPYIQVLYRHFFGSMQDMELNPASPSRATTPAKPWWGRARWKSESV